MGKVFSEVEVCPKMAKNGVKNGWFAYDMAIMICMRGFLCELQSQATPSLPLLVSWKRKFCVPPSVQNASCVVLLMRFLSQSVSHPDPTIE